MSEHGSSATPTGGDAIDPMPSLYERVGGMPFFETLVAAFYDGVRTDAPLISLYPEPNDLSGARRRLATFLSLIHI